MNREDLDDLIEKWHVSDTKLSLREYLGLTEEQYSIYVEFDILPGENIPFEKFAALRSDAYRWADNADRQSEENKRYREAIAGIKELLGTSLPSEGWVHADDISDILEVNNV